MALFVLVESPCDRVIQQNADMGRLEAIAAQVQSTHQVVQMTTLLNCLSCIYTF